jgi:hypothetical protein
VVAGDLDSPILNAFFARVTGDGAEPEPVLAYHSIGDLRREQGIGKRASLDQRRAEIAYSALNWKIDVPEPTSDKFDEAKLKAAVALAVEDQWRTNRKAFNGWVKSLANRAFAPEAVCKELEPLLKRLEDLNSTIRTRKRIHQVARFSSVPAALAGLASPPIAVVASLASIGISLAVEYFLRVPDPAPRLGAAAYVQEAREFLVAG